MEVVRCLEGGPAAGAAAVSVVGVSSSDGGMIGCSTKKNVPLRWSDTFHNSESSTTPPGAAFDAQMVPTSQPALMSAIQGSGRPRIAVLKTQPPLLARVCNVVCGLISYQLLHSPQPRRDQCGGAAPMSQSVRLLRYFARCCSCLPERRRQRQLLTLLDSCCCSWCCSLNCRAAAAYATCCVESRQRDAAPRA
jgi:hypothetical protein